MCSIFSNSSIILPGLQASIGVTRSYSSRPFLCALGACHPQSIAYILCELNSILQATIELIVTPENETSINEAMRHVFFPIVCI